MSQVQQQYAAMNNTIMEKIVTAGVNRYKANLSKQSASHTKQQTYLLHNQQLKAVLQARLEHMWMHIASSATVVNDRELTEKLQKVITDSTTRYVAQLEEQVDVNNCKNSFLKTV